MQTLYPFYISFIDHNGHTAFIRIYAYNEDDAREVFEIQYNLEIESISRVD